MPTYGSEDQELSLMLPPVCNTAATALAVRIILRTHHGHPEWGFSVNSHGWDTMDEKYCVSIQSWVCKIEHHP